MRLAWIFLFAVASFLAPPAVRAQSDEDQQAHTHFDSGHLHFERGEYDDALREFEAAYALSHRAPLLYNLYLTLERLGRTGDAADRLETYLASDVVIEPSERDTLQARLTNLRARAVQTVAEASPAPTPAPAPASGGIHALGLAGIVTLAVGGATLIGWAIAGGLALSEDGRLANSCGRNVGSFCTDSDVSTLRTLDTAADVMLSIGLVAAAVGAVLLIIDLTSSPSGAEHTAHLSPILSPTLVGLTVGGAL